MSHIIFLALCVAIATGHLLVALIISIGGYLWKSKAH